MGVPPWRGLKCAGTSIMLEVKHSRVISHATGESWSRSNGFNLEHEFEASNDRLQNRKSIKTSC